MQIEIVSESGLSEHSLRKIFALKNSSSRDEPDLAIIETQEKL